MVDNVFTGPGALAASGYAIEIATTESVTAVFAFTPAEPNGKAIHLRSFLIAPSRPGLALRSAAARGLPVDATDAEIAVEWPRWYRANREAVGPDPDRLLPGLRLRAPQPGS